MNPKITNNNITIMTEATAKHAGNQLNSCCNCIQGLNTTLDTFQAIVLDK